MRVDIVTMVAIKTCTRRFSNHISPFPTVRRLPHASESLRLLDFYSFSYAIHCQLKKVSLSYGSMFQHFRIISNLGPSMLSCRLLTTQVKETSDNLFAIPFITNPVVDCEMLKTCFPLSAQNKSMTWLDIFPNCRYLLKQPTSTFTLIEASNIMIQLIDD